jgi:hypothetical protein
MKSIARKKDAFEVKEHGVVYLFYETIKANESLDLNMNMYMIQLLGGVYFHVT